MAQQQGQQCAQQQAHRQDTHEFLKKVNDQMMAQQDKFIEAAVPFGERNKERSLVDSRAVAKPANLPNNVADDANTFKIWRIKFTNWICAAMPHAAALLEKLEVDSHDEFTDEIFEQYCKYVRGLHKCAVESDIGEHVF